MTRPICILIVDDHTVVRDGLKALISAEPGMKVIGAAGDGLEAVHLAKDLQPDVILMDLVMPRMDGVQATLEIKKVYPQARILVLTSFSEDHMVVSAIRAGAIGFLMKDTSSEELLQAIQDTYRNKPVLGPEIARRLMEEIQGEDGGTGGAGGLDRSRSRDLAADGAGSDQPGDRRRPGAERAHGAHARDEYPGQAGVVEPYPGGALRPARRDRPY